MPQHKPSKLHDPWTIGSFLLFGGSLACSVFFRNWFHYSDILLAFSVFGLLVSLVYATLPDDAESKAARDTVQAAEEIEASHAHDPQQDEQDNSSRLQNVLVAIIIISFVVAIVSSVLFFCFDVQGCVPLVLVFSSMVFGASFWGTLYWKMTSGPWLGPWWWGL